MRFQISAAIVRFAVVLACCASISAADEPPETWIFAGQSNMNPGAMFKAFATEVNRVLPDKRLDMVASQRSGKPISYWDEGEEGWQKLTDGIQGKPRIGGMVFYQGESDQRNALAYRKALESFIARVRKTTGQPKLPVVIVQLGTYRPTIKDNHEWGFGLVREMQRRTAAADPHVALVPAMDQPIGDQIVHLTTEGKTEVGRRAGLAALNIAFGKTEVGYGPQAVGAAFVNEKRTRVAIQFEGLQGELAVSLDTCTQGLTAIDELPKRGDLSQWDSQTGLPELLAVSQWPMMTAAKRDILFVEFARPLAADAQLSWGLLPNATWGPRRRWEMPISGITDESGIVAPAFALLPIEPVGAAWLRNVNAADAPWTALLARRPFERDKSWRIAVNMIGSGLPITADDVAGPEGLSQGWWNPVGAGYHPNLYDHYGRLSQIAVTSGAWYARPRQPTADTADAKLMATGNTEHANVIHGLTPGEAYQIVVYTNGDSGAERPAMYDFQLRDGKSKQAKAGKTIRLTEPDAGPSKGELRHDFHRYVEATSDNGYVGNYLIFPLFAAGPEGEIVVDIRPPKPKQGEKKIKQRICAMQIIYHGK